MTVLILTSARFMTKRQAALVLTPIAKTNEPFRGVRRPTGRYRPKDRKMTKDEMIEWFKSAPMGSRHRVCYGLP